MAVSKKGISSLTEILWEAGRIVLAPNRYIWNVLKYISNPVLLKQRVIIFYLLWIYKNKFPVPCEMLFAITTCIISSVESVPIKFLYKQVLWNRNIYSDLWERLLEAVANGRRCSAISPTFQSELERNAVQNTHIQSFHLLERCRELCDRKDDAWPTNIR